jgi:hypothetical protein
MATTLGWTWAEIAALPVTRVWAFYEHWKKQPPVHVLLAMFLDYNGKGDGEYVPRGTSGSKTPGFDITPTFLSAFGPGVKQSQLHPAIRKSVEQMQSSPKYLAWRESLIKQVA